MAAVIWLAQGQVRARRSRRRRPPRTITHIPVGQIQQAGEPGQESVGAAAGAGPDQQLEALLLSADTTMRSEGGQRSASQDLGCPPPELTVLDGARRPAPGRGPGISSPCRRPGFSTCRCTGRSPAAHTGDIRRDRDLEGPGVDPRRMGLPDRSQGMLRADAARRAADHGVDAPQTGLPGGSVLRPVCPRITDPAAQIRPSTRRLPAFRGGSK